MRRWTQRTSKLRSELRDLKEDVFPSAMPDDADGPYNVEPRKYTASEKWEAVKEGTAEYLRSWKTLLDKTEEEKQVELYKKEELDKAMGDLFKEMRSSKPNMAPLVKKLGSLKLATFREAMTEFKVGYQEGKSGEHKWTWQDYTDAFEKSLGRRSEKAKSNSGNVEDKKQQQEIQPAKDERAKTSGGTASGGLGGGHAPPHDSTSSGDSTPSGPNSSQDRGEQHDK